MTPRERAEALGWVRRTPAGDYVRWDFPPAQSAEGWPVSSYVVGERTLWGVGFRGRWVPDGYDAEDEALAHALLLRDVVLS